jgi:hypothetical protein
VEGDRIFDEVGPELRLFERNASGRPLRVRQRIVRFEEVAGRRRFLLDENVRRYRRQRRAVRVEEGVPELASRLEALGGIPGQRTAYDIVVPLPSSPGIRLRRLRRAAAADAVRDLLRRSGIGWPTREQPEEHRAGGEEVGARVDSLAGVRLGRDESGHARLLVELLAAAVLGRRAAEIRDLGSATPRDEDARRVDGAVAHAVLVRVPQRVQDLSDDADRVRLAEPDAAVEIVAEAMPLHELHREVGDRSRLAVVVDSDDAGV